MNVRAAFIHVLGDFLQSVGVFLAAVLIWFKVRLVGSSIRSFNCLDTIFLGLHCLMACLPETAARFDWATARGRL